MKAEEALQELVTKMYVESGVTVEPNFPFVLVRLLPKSQRTMGGIWLPDKDQNKPVHEAIVLRVYKPRRMRNKKDGSEYVVDSSVNPGDHVLFQHFEGVPIPRLDFGVGEYRLVNEGAFHAVLHYSAQNMRDWLKQVVFKSKISDQALDELLSNADVIRKDQVAMTVSGR